MKKTKKMKPARKHPLTLVLIFALMLSLTAGAVNYTEKSKPNVQSNIPGVSVNADNLKSVIDKDGNVIVIDNPENLNITVERVEAFTGGSDWLKPLSEKMELRIKTDYHEYRGRLYSVDDVIIDRYCGTYDGCVAMMIKYIYDYEATLFLFETIAGYEFVYPTLRSIVVWKDGEFYLLKEAYEDGLLTKRDIGNIWKH